jgi:ribose 5-phosphate isomerase B
MGSPLQTSAATPAAWRAVRPGGNDAHRNRRRPWRVCSQRSARSVTARPRYEIRDFGALALNHGDDYPDYIIPLARAVAAGEVERGLALCGSGVGASIAANKVPGVRAGLVHDVFSAHQGVEDDNMNVFCLGGNVIGTSLALELIEKFLGARFSGAARHQRRIAKVQAKIIADLRSLAALRFDAHLNDR